LLFADVAVPSINWALFVFGRLNRELKRLLRVFQVPYLEEYIQYNKENNNI